MVAVLNVIIDIFTLHSEDKFDIFTCVCGSLTVTLFHKQITPVSHFPDNLTGKEKIYEMIKFHNLKFN